MLFFPVLSHNDEPHPIWLPYPIQLETSPNQTPWQWDDPFQNVACPVCNHVSAYSAPNCHWEPAQSTDQLTWTKQTGVYLLSVPCEIGPSACLIDILVIERRGLPPQAGSEVANRIFLRGALCGKEHSSSGPLAVKVAPVFRPMEVPLMLG